MGTKDLIVVELKQIVVSSALYAKQVRA